MELLARPLSTIKTVIATGVLSIVFAATALTGQVSAAVSVNATRDCDTNAILRCGALNTDELNQKCDAANNQIRAVYTWYGINSSDIDNMGTTAVAGAVNKNGDVVVGGKVVAKNAISAGWHNMPGSTPVTYNGATFYNSVPSTSFVADSIPAYVVLNKDGQYRFAILASCANPVKATNVVPKPAPTPPVQTPPAPTPPVVTPPAPEAPPVVQPVTQPQPQPQPEKLVAAGPASAATAAGIFIAVSAVAALAHGLLVRKRRSL